MKPKLLDILIPTYTREQDLKANLNLLTKELGNFRLIDKVNIIISNNASKDNTSELILGYSTKFDNVFCFNQETNIGPEPNVIFCLDQAKSDFVMFLGDDDFLPKGYLFYIINILTTKHLVSSIIPGCIAVFEGVRRKVFRDAKFEEKIYPPSVLSTFKLLAYAHQLSGIVLKREMILETYLREPNLRNLYPFMTFLGINTNRGFTLYSPKWKVEIAQYNSKDWSYTETYLFSDMFMNLRILYKNIFLISLLEFKIILYHYKRIPTNFQKFIDFNVACLRDKNFSLTTKLSFPIIILIVLFKHLLMKLQLD